MLTAAVATDHLHTYVHVHMDVHTLTHNHSQAHTCTHTRTKTHMHTHRRCPSRIPCGFWMTCPTAKCFRSCRRWATRCWCKWFTSTAMMHVLQVRVRYTHVLVCTSFDLISIGLQFHIFFDFPVSPSQRCTDWKSFSILFPLIVPLDKRRTGQPRGKRWQSSRHIEQAWPLTCSRHSLVDVQPAVFSSWLDSEPAGRRRRHSVKESFAPVLICLNSKTLSALRIMITDNRGGDSLTCIHQVSGGNGTSNRWKGPE